MSATPRSCPVCRVPMAVRESRGVEVDLCPDCTGLWLDRGEFDALIAQRLTGEDLEAALDGSAKDPDYCRFCDAQTHEVTCPTCDRELALSCPADGAAMYVVVFGGMEFDRCHRCGGIWLDGHERLALGKSSRNPAAPASPPPEVPAARAPASSRPALGAARRYERLRCPECGKETQRGKSREVSGRLLCEPCGRRLVIAERQRALELAGSAQAAADAMVGCGACGRTIPRRHCVERNGHLICEPCVVAGRLESDPRFGLGPPTVIVPLPSGDAESGEWSEEAVLCAGCDQLVRAAATIVTMGEHYCEGCVVAGRYPGDKGLNLDELRLKAAVAFAAARADLSVRKAAVDRRSELREAMRHRGFMGQRMGAVKGDLEIVDTLRDLLWRWRFRGRKV